VNHKLKRKLLISFLVLLMSLVSLGPSSAQNIVLSYLTGATSDVALKTNEETLIWNFNVYPPISPKFQLALNILERIPAACTEPVDLTHCPDHWSVLLMLTPITLYNDSARVGVATITVYSDNAYVYQQRATVAPRAYVPISFGALSLGYIMNSAPNVPMPVRVTITATEVMTVLRDTAQSTGLQPGAHRVWGAVVELRPM
jgi:hypothetical protein